LKTEAFHAARDSGAFGPTTLLLCLPDGFDMMLVAEPVCETGPAAASPLALTGPNDQSRYPADKSQPDYQQ
jgi:hypothetical protein